MTLPAALLEAGAPQEATLELVYKNDKSLVFAFTDDADEPLDLTGVTEARLHLFDLNGTEITVSWPLVASGAAIDTAGGTITFSITAAISGALSFPSGDTTRNPVVNLFAMSVNDGASYVTVAAGQVTCFRWTR